ncbi:isochorismate synthase [Ktedonosporobacter rubrisoli]|uniref:isochorismate synthase n=1 Tax=Ktedonosporobacter rubrisoli TaxID=2509675 RepID=A0A4P6JRK0_KTERU|nr:isochorismate synthase [Ktedonosporobacter rubrisoli]QBD77446.1 isochorismate synthase [Ktedonosporobacter rubrisoli]
MDIVFIDTPDTSDITGLESVVRHREQLLSTLLQASHKASSLHQNVLASLTLPIAAEDPLLIFKTFKQGSADEIFFWAHPEEQSAFVGVGAAITIEATGLTRCASAAAQWHAIQEHAVITASSIHLGGPMLFGGFSFDPLLPSQQLWQDFPDALLILPLLHYHYSGTRAALTINQPVNEGDDIARLADEISARIRSLHEAIEAENGAGTVQDKASLQLSIQNLLPESAWKSKVADAVKMIQSGAFEKVVLARGVRVVNTAEEAFDIGAVLPQLYKTYPSAHIFAFQRGQRTFVGATPEPLIEAHNKQLRTMPLAGSAPRGETEAEDRRLGTELLHSAKNKVEHEIVVVTIQKVLASLCSTVRVEDTPHLLRLKNIQHLATTIVGDLLPGHSLLEALQDLAPTPAVGGFPRKPALEFIRKQEGLERGWYSGSIGWLDMQGNGEFALALRSALIEGNQAILFAGGGIVADSHPESEYSETCWKLQVMLRGLRGKD